MNESHYSVIFNLSNITIIIILIFISMIFFAVKLFINRTGFRENDVLVVGSICIALYSIWLLFKLLATSPSFQSDELLIPIFWTIIINMYFLIKQILDFFNKS